MTGENSGDSTDETTVLIRGYPMLDFFLISLVSGLFFIGIVAIVVRGWQLFVQDSAVLLPAIIGTVVAFGALLSVPFLIDLDSI